MFLLLTKRQIGRKAGGAHPRISKLGGMQQLVQPGELLRAEAARGCVRLDAPAHLVHQTLCTARSDEDEVRNAHRSDQSRRCTPRSGVPGQIAAKLGQGTGQKVANSPMGAAPLRWQQPAAATHPPGWCSA